MHPSPQALAYFDAAEKGLFWSATELCWCTLVILSSLNAADPDFYVPNWLYLGKSYYQLGKKEDARKWLKKAAEHHGDVPDDKEVYL